MPDQPIVIANQISPSVGHTLRAHLDRSGRCGVVVVDAIDSLPWDLTQDADVILTAPRNGWAQAPAETPPGWPGRVKWVHTASVGVDVFPRWLPADPALQFSVGRGVAAVPLAEYAMAALLDHAKQLGERRIHQAADWMPVMDALKRPLGLLQGQTLGLAGYGAVGREVAVRARAFGMRVLAWKRSDTPITDAGVERVDSVQALVEQSDQLVIGLPLTDATRGLFNAGLLARAKPGAHLVNVARGAIVDQMALLAALDHGPLSRATLDATEPEPLPEGHPLYTHPKVVLTPHISWAAGNPLALGVEKFLGNLERFLAGQPVSDRVDPALGY